MVTLGGWGCGRGVVVLEERDAVVERDGVARETGERVELHTEGCELRYDRLEWGGLGWISWKVLGAEA